MNTMLARSAKGIYVLNYGSSLFLFKTNVRFEERNVLHGKNKYSRAC